jgi:hypothetical protein
MDSELSVLVDQNSDLDTVYNRESELITGVTVPSQHVRDLTDYIAAYAPLIAVLVAVGLGIVQAYLQRQRLKQDLYEKRYSVYSSVIDFWHYLVESRASGQAKLQTIERRNQFYSQIRHAKFLFGRDVITFLEEYHALAAQLQDAATAQRYGPDRSPEGAQEVNRLYDKLTLFAGIKNEEVFRPYLQLYQAKGWFARWKSHLDHWEASLDLESQRIGDRLAKVEDEVRKIQQSI